jgi:hypothetical protein
LESKSELGPSLATTSLLKRSKTNIPDRSIAVAKTFALYDSTHSSSEVHSDAGRSNLLLLDSTKGAGILKGLIDRVGGFAFIPLFNCKTPSLGVIIFSGLKHQVGFAQKKLKISSHRMSTWVIEKNT